MTITVVSGQQPKKKFLLTAGQFFLLESQVGNGVKKEQTSAEKQLLKTTDTKK
jgi:hypothetical protein